MSTEAFYMFMEMYSDGLLYIKKSHLTSYFNRICNFTGLPAISTPMGLDSNEMPIGIQFISKWVCLLFSANSCFLLTIIQVGRGKASRYWHVLGA